MNRKQNPDKRDYDRRQNRARSRALTRLATAHPDEFAELLNEERQREGMDPVGANGVGRPPKYAS